MGPGILFYMNNILELRKESVSSSYSSHFECKNFLKSQTLSRDSINYSIHVQKSQK